MAADPFFAGSSGSKRKRANKGAVNGPNTKQRPIKGKGKKAAPVSAPAREDSDEVLSSEDDSEAAGALEEDEPLSSEGEDDARETTAQKRMRLAQIYLDNLQKQHSQGPDGFDAAEIDKDYIEQRLQSDVVCSTLSLAAPPG